MLSDKAKQIADEAKKQGKWLFEPSYKRWYSPEDFKHIFSYADAKDDFLAGLQVRHPNEGIEAGFKRITALQTKLEIFVQTVIEYYNKF